MIYHVAVNFNYIETHTLHWEALEVSSIKVHHADFFFAVYHKSLVNFGKMCPKKKKKNTQLEEMN